MRDARFLLGLLLAGSVIPAVLLEVTLLPCRVNLVGDLRAPGGHQVLKFRIEPVKSVLGKPRGHNSSPHECNKKTGSVVGEPGLQKNHVSTEGLVGVRSRLRYLPTSRASSSVRVARRGGRERS